MSGATHADFELFHPVRRLVKGMEKLSPASPARKRGTRASDGTLHSWVPAFAGAASERECGLHLAGAARKARALVLAAAAALLLTSGTAMAQSAATGMGATTLGIPGDATPDVSGPGIPLGATELGDDGLSPSPLGTGSTLTTPGADLTGSLDAPPLAMPGAAGLGASPNGGLSPGVMAPQCAMPGAILC